LRRNAVYNVFDLSHVAQRFWRRWEAFLGVIRLKLSHKMSDPDEKFPHNVFRKACPLAVPSLLIGFSGLLFSQDRI
jgi:hypothetical protein